MKIFNTLTEKKEDLPEKKKLNLFVCGPTVYDFSHIGHARTYIAFDNIVRYLRSRKIKVFYLQNITDVDDKIIDRARLQKTAPKTIARSFEKEYYRDMKALGVSTVDRYARASDFIKEIQKQIARLIKKGFAYQTGSGVYFEVKKFSDYGKLSKQNLEALRPGYRIEPDPEKKDSLDFALWKIKKGDDEPSWLSPWGEGRPGWHIEDTAISEAFFGPQYDLHGGAVDLKFPHHESEIAQQEAASGKKPFVAIWLHTGFLLINGEKMSKSLGNFLTIRDFLKQHSPETLRFLVASHHYRSPINYELAATKQAAASLQTLRQTIAKLYRADKKGGLSAAVAKHLKTSEQQFTEAMADDFNTPDALASLFTLINRIQPQFWQLTSQEAKGIISFLTANLRIFGIIIKKPAAIPAPVKALLQKRELSRVHKQFTQADALRKAIEALGYIIEDTPNGPLVFKK